MTAFGHLKGHVGALGNYGVLLDLPVGISLRIAVRLSSAILTCHQQLENGMYIVSQCGRIREGCVTGTPEL